MQARTVYLTKTGNFLKETHYLKNDALMRYRLIKKTEASVNYRNRYLRANKFTRY
jgi:hypothetical protein